MMTSPLSASARRCGHRKLTTTNQQILLQRIKLARYGARGCSTVARATTTPISEQLAPAVSIPHVGDLDVQTAKEGLAVLQQYAGKAAGAAGAVWGSLTSPFQVFGDAWFLNIMFFGILVLLTYSLLILAPKQ